MLELSGEILSADKTINLENLDARLISDNINIQIAGSVNDLVRSKVIHTSLNADIGPLTEQNISELTALLQHFNIELPTPLLPKGAHISAKIRGNIDALAVKDINIEIRDDGLIVALVGQVGNALPPSGVDATVTVASDSLSVFSKYAGISIPALGALNVSTHIVSSDSGYRLQNLDARLGADEYDLTLSASIRDLLTLKGINAELSSTINSLAALSTIARKELPQTEPITLNATVSEGDETGDKGAMVTIEAASAGATVVLNGLLSDLTSAEDLTISIAVDAPSLSDFNQFSPNELPEKGPFSLTGNVEIKPGEFELNDFEVNLEDQSMNGNIGIKLAQDDSAHSTLKGELNIPYFDLSPYVIPDPDQVPDSTQPETVEATKPVSNQAGRKTDLAAEASEAVVPEPADRLFSSDPIPLDQLRKFDADFTVTADKLKIGKTDATDLEVTLSLVDGLLRVDPIKGLAGPGRLDGNVTIDGRSDAVVLAVDLLVDDMPMPNLGGGLDVKIKLDGEGQSVAEIMGGLDGRVLVVMRDGIIESSFVTNYGSGLFSFSGSKDTTELECGILRVDIEDGIADFDKKLAAQMTDVTWKGGGDINLKTESLDAGIVPKPRKGLGIGGGALAGLVHIGGTLKHPKIQLDPKDVAVKYGKYMAYVSTGGLSLLAEALYNKSQSDVDVCAKILDGTVFDEDETPESE